MEGIITKGVGGQYEVKVTSDCDVKGERVICTARGGIRNKRLTPAIGDMVDIGVSGDPDVPYVIQKIKLCFVIYNAITLTRVILSQRTMRTFTKDICRP